MAADLVLIAIPQGQFGPYDAVQLMRYRTNQDHVDDDRVRSGLITAGEARDELNAFFYDSFLDLDSSPDVLGVGAWSPMKALLFDDAAYLPEPHLQIDKVWRRGGIVTPPLVAKTLVAMNLANRSRYLHLSQRGTGRGKRKWRSMRQIRAQYLKKWLNSHLGDVMWSESW